MSAPTITVSAVGKVFSNNWVFRDVSFEVPQSGSFVILGPSGSGKSVLLKMIAGLLPCDSGQISLETQDLGMLFQNNALFDSMTAEENLIFPLRESGVSGSRDAAETAKRMLAQVGLENASRLFPAELSGGMRKRLGIARALIVRPKILLYDEPTAGLDPVTSRLIADVILRSKAELGSTLVTVTNDLSRAYQLGTQIALLARGKLKVAGTPEQVRASRDPEIRQFVYGLQVGPLTQIPSGP